MSLPITNTDIASATPVRTVTIIILREVNTKDLAWKTDPADISAD
jgi:hypothetical protein